MGSTSSHKLFVGLWGLLISIIAPLEDMLIIFMILIGIDTILGVTKALKFGVFSSTKFRASIVKIIFYMITIILGALIDAILLREFNLNIRITQYLIGILCLSEFLSALENINDMGINIPYISIASKIRKAIPLFPNQIKTIKNKIIANGVNVLKEKEDIYSYWVMLTKNIMEEAQKMKFDEMDDKNKKILIKAYKKRIYGHITCEMKNEIGEKYANYVKFLVDLYDEIPPINEENYYILLNKGLSYENEQKKSNNKSKVSKRRTKKVQD